MQNIVINNTISTTAAWEEKAASSLFPKHTLEIR